MIKWWLLNYWKLFISVLVHWKSIIASPLQHEFNSLVPKRAGCDFRNAIFNFVFRIGISRSFFFYNVFSWMQWRRTDKSTLVQVMAWCRQVTSYYLNQYWPRSMSPYGVTRPQWVKQPAFTHRAFTPLAVCNWPVYNRKKGAHMQGNSLGGTWRVFHYNNEITSLWLHFREPFKSVFVASYFRGLKHHTSS